MREEREALVLALTLPPPFSTGKRGRCPEGAEGVDFVFCLGIRFLWQ
jgi:hypothetical protein